MDHFINQQPKGQQKKNNREDYFNLDYFCRHISNLIDMDLLDYLQEAKGMMFDRIYTDHVNNCINKKCFCNDFKDQDQSNFQSLFDQQTRNQFLCLLISQLYNNFLAKNFQDKNRNYEKLKFSYFYFLIEIQQIPTKSFVELIQELNKSNKSATIYKNQYTLQEIYHACLQSFSFFWKKSSIQNQRLNMMSVIDFSDLTEEVSILIRDCLIEKRDLFIYLNQDLIDLNFLVHKFWNFLENQKKLSLKITSLFDIYPNSKYVISLAQIFTQNFDIQRRKFSKFIKESKQVMKTFLKEEDYGIDLFNHKSCMVFITLIENLGFIKRASKSFEILFGVKAQDVIGKSCNMMMPDCIAGIHDDSLRHFVERGNMVNLKKGIIFGFGKRKNGFMFPVHARTKLEIYQGVDFGVNGYFQEVNKDFDYFLCETEGGILDVTERIFKLGFQHIFQQNKKNIDTCRIIPLVGLMVQQNSYAKQPGYVDTIMCVPVENDLVSKFRKTKLIDLKSESEELFMLLIKLDQFKFYNVSLRVERIDTSIGVSVIFVEFRKVNKIREYSEILEKLNDLKKEIQNQLNIKLDLNINQSLSYLSQQSPESKFTKQYSLCQVQNNQFNLDETKPASQVFSPIISQNRRDFYQSQFNTANSPQRKQNSPNLNRNSINYNFTLENQFVDFKLTDRISITSRDIETPKNSKTPEVYSQKYSKTQLDQIVEEQLLSQDNYRSPMLSTLSSNQIDNFTLLSNRQNPNIPNSSNQMEQFREQMKDYLQYSNSNIYKNLQFKIKLKSFNDQELTNAESNLQLNDVFVKEFANKDLNNNYFNPSTQSNDGNDDADEKNYMKQMDGDIFLIDQQSQISSVKDLNHEKQQLKKQILDSRAPKIARYFIQIGQSCSFVSLIIPILFLGFFVNFMLNQNLKFENCMLFYDIINSTNQVTHKVEQTRFYQSGITSIHILNLKSEFSNYQQIELYNLQQFKQNIALLMGLKQDENGANFIDNFKSQFKNYDNILTDVSFFIWIQSILVFGYQYILSPSEPDAQVPVYSNFIQFIQILQQAFENSLEDSRNSLNQLVNLIYYNLIFNIIVITLAILIVIPIVLIVEKKKKDFVKLICTYPRDKLDEYLEETCFALKEHYIENGHLFSKTKDDYQIMRQATTHFGTGKQFVDLIIFTSAQNGNQQLSKVVDDQSKKKKRAISQTISLNTQKIQIIVLTTICYVALIVLPLIQYFFGNYQINKIFFQINLAENLSQINFQINRSYSEMYLNLNMKIFKNNPPFNQYNLSSQYFDDFFSILQKNQDLNNQFQQLQQQLTNYASDDQNEAKIISNILSNDSCQVLNDNLNLIDNFTLQSHGNITQYCTGKENEFLIKRGLVLSSQYLFQTCQQLSTFLKQDSSDILQLAQNFDDQNNLHSLSQINPELDASVSICLTLVKQNIQNQTTVLYSIFYILFSFQLLILVIIYYYLWSKVHQEISLNFHKIKNLFTFFSIDQILQNSYIKNYLTGEIRSDVVQ
ncbi:transmembrane protein, putative (macronuclear) [Tetrahymena thermophila SB210]|uniref:Transmembrane protein, putative n=1 Tax=Tetrahymena thermophila (strain SB210) TaxID=312017 RepID=Q22EI6_TETTS|nr:transmembrane protein, putative [Tetrahymena thermophila SB210]EAR83666.2 transmembrane protein, putative [Tetrahymena thermophila SB210]|eukprot:XP_001031329.2 transmembrane protein, putative [Tetrahymena thermophila SB210]